MVLDRRQRKGLRTIHYSFQRERLHRFPYRDLESHAVWCDASDQCQVGKDEKWQGKSESNEIFVKLNNAGICYRSIWLKVLNLSFQSRNVG